MIIIKIVIHSNKYSIGLTAYFGGRKKEKYKTNRLLLCFNFELKENLGKLRAGGARADKESHVSS